MLTRIFFLGAFLMVGVVQACMWDDDTLRDERRGLPSVFDILAGKYERRSEAFYRDRVEKMERHLAAHPDDQAAIDNLAVALFRLGEVDRAIASMEDKERRFPRQYTTASNLATFHMLRGNHAAAIPLLEQALAINPNAHFGREEYQLRLARFLLAAEQAEEYPTADFLGYEVQVRVSHSDGSVGIRWRDGLFDNPHRHWTIEDAEAMRGILGMIRFGTDQSPDLYFALGNLLLKKQDKHLALRAYWRAIDLEHPQKQMIEVLVKMTLEFANPGEEEKRARFAAEEEAGQKWSAAYMAYTDDLVARQLDAEDESAYADFYRLHGRPGQLEEGEEEAVLPTHEEPVPSPNNSNHNLRRALPFILGLLAFFGLMLLGVLWMIVRFIWWAIHAEPEPEPSPTQAVSSPRRS